MLSLVTLIEDENKIKKKEIVSSSFLPQSCWLIFMCLFHTFILCLTDHNANAVWNPDVLWAGQRSRILCHSCGRGEYSLLPTAVGSFGLDWPSIKSCVQGDKEGEKKRYKLWNKGKKFCFQLKYSFMEKPVSPKFGFLCEWMFLHDPHGQR